MQDDTITTKSEEQSGEETEKNGTGSQSTENASHPYYEVGGDLLSKPNVLCDILEVTKPKTTVVFCNTPSEADFVEVILKKRNFRACKLVGHVPTVKVVSSVKEVKNGDYQVLIVTDVAARELEVEELELVVNYSIPADPEVYIHRMGRDGHGGSAHKIISLVSPADITNFHYLKKIVGFEFTKVELPGQESMLEVKIKSFAEQAAEFFSSADELTKKALSLIMKEKNKDEILTLLTHNTFNVIPELRASVNGSGDEDRNSSGRNRSRSDKRERGGRGPRNKDYSDSQDRNSDRGENRRSRGGPRHQQDDNYDRDETQAEPERRRQDPPAKELRIYVGHGTDSGMSEEKLSKTISESKEMEGYNVTRLIVRKHYSFVDFPEGTDDEVVDTLNNISLNDKETLFARKATLISVPRPPKKAEDGSSESEQGDNTGSNESDSEQLEQASQE